MQVNPYVKNLNGMQNALTQIKRNEHIPVLCLHMVYCVLYSFIASDLPPRQHNTSQSDLFLSCLCD